jgi:DNA-binding response OmpR family regulator
MASKPPASGATSGHTLPGILYYDPNTTTAKLATAGLRLAGFQVFNAHTLADAVDLCKKHGPAGDRAVMALLLDAAVDPAASAAVLKALVQIPGGAQLPGILLVSRSNPTPIPGAEGLPSLRRPFSTPALVKVVHEALEDQNDAPSTSSSQISVDLVVNRLKQLLYEHFPGQEFSETEIDHFARALRTDDELALPTDRPVIRGALGAARLEAVLEMLGNMGVRGILKVEDGAKWGKLHIDQGRIRLAEVKGTEEDLKLGRFVVEGGFMRDEQLEAFIVGKDPEQRPLGTRLLEAGFISQADLAQIVVDQARAVTSHLLTWKSGTFTFAPVTDLDSMAAAAAAQGRTELLVSEALLDGLRWLDEATVMGPHMPDVEDVYLRIDEQVAKLSREALPRDELAVLELVNGRNSVKEIARKTRTGTFAVARVLYRHAKANLVRKRVMPVAV